jgi:hypothetical protein
MIWQGRAAPAAGPARRDGVGGATMDENRAAAPVRLAPFRLTG